MEDEERDGRYRRGLQDQVMLTGALPRPTRVFAYKSEVSTVIVCGSFSRTRTHTSRTSVEMHGVAFAESALREKNTKKKVEKKKK